MKLQAMDSDGIAALGTPDFWRSFLTPGDESYLEALPAAGGVRRVTLSLGPEFSLVWETDGDETLYLQAGTERAQVGWIDSHHHPFCLRLEEFRAILAHLGGTELWGGSPAPLLLLHRYVGLCSEADARWMLARVSAQLLALGAIDAIPEVEMPAGVEADHGMIRFSSGAPNGMRWGTVAQTGATWFLSDAGWEFLPTKAQPVISEFAGYPVPVAAYSMRVTDRLRFFSEARATIESAAERHESHGEEEAPFPWDTFRRAMAGLGVES